MWQTRVLLFAFLPLISRREASEEDGQRREITWGEDEDTCYHFAIWSGASVKTLGSPCHLLVWGCAVLENSLRGAKQQMMDRSSVN